MSDHGLFDNPTVTVAGVEVRATQPIEGAHMSPIESWGLLALVLLAVVVVGLALGALLDWFVGKVGHRDADLDEVRHRDHAREVMASWVEPTDAETERMLNRALERPGEVVVFERDDDGVLHEVETPDRGGDGRA